MGSSMRRLLVSFFLLAGAGAGACGGPSNGALTDDDGTLDGGPAGAGGTGGGGQPECVNSLDCELDEVCDRTVGMCVDCLSDADCDLADECIGRSCRPACDSDMDCTPLGLLCDLGRGRCVECVLPGDCSAGTLCRDGACVPGCETNSDCAPLGQECDTSVGRCVPPAGTGGSGGGTGGTGGGSGGSGGGGGCTTLPAQHSSVGFVLVLDRTGSMTGGKLDALKQAATAFIQDSGSDGLGIALHVFGVDGGAMCPAACVDQTDCDPCGGTCFPGLGCIGGGVGSSCEPTDYAMPVQPYGRLPTVAAALQAEISVLSATGGSPIAPALQGAIASARGLANANGDTEMVVVFTADGEPTSCTPDTVAGLAGIAATGPGESPPVRVHVIQFDLSSPSFAPISMAGGTNAWPRISDTAPTAPDILAILQQIRRGERDCKFDVPAAFNGDPVSALTVTTNDGGSTTVDVVGDATGCSGGRGVYEEPGPAARRLVFCPASCDDANAPRATVEVSRGCP